MNPPNENQSGASQQLPNGSLNPALAQLLLSFPQYGVGQYGANPGVEVLQPFPSTSLPGLQLFQPAMQMGMMPMAMMGLQNPFLVSNALSSANAALANAANFMETLQVGQGAAAPTQGFPMQANGSGGMGPMANGMLQMPGGSAAAAVAQPSQADVLTDFIRRAHSLIPDRGGDSYSGGSGSAASFGFSGPANYSMGLMSGLAGLERGMVSFGPTSAPVATAGAEGAAAAAAAAAAGQGKEQGQIAKAEQEQGVAPINRRKAKALLESMMRQVLKCLRSLFMYTGSEQRERNKDLYGAVSTLFNNISIPRFRRYYAVVETAVRDAWGGSFEYQDGDASEVILGRLIADFVAFMCRPHAGETPQQAVQRVMFERIRQQEQREPGSTLGIFLRRQGGSERRGWIYVNQNPECRMLYQAVMAPDGVANKVIAQWRILQKEKEFSAPAAWFTPGGAAAQGLLVTAGAPGTVPEEEGEDMRDDAGPSAGAAAAGPASPGAAMSDGRARVGSERPMKKARPEEGSEGAGVGDGAVASGARAGGSASGDVTVGGGADESEVSEMAA